MDRQQFAGAVVQALQPQRLLVLHRLAEPLAPAFQLLGVAVDELQPGKPLAGQAYDAVVVLAPLEAGAVQDWLPPLCAVTGTLVFVSLPGTQFDVQDDFLQPMVAISEALASRQFYRNWQVDLLPVASWSAVFQSGTVRVENLVAGYESIIGEMTRANQDLRFLARSLSDQLAAQQSQPYLEELQAYRRDAQSISWRLVQKFRRGWRRIRALAQRR